MTHADYCVRLTRPTAASVMERDDLPAIAGISLWLRHVSCELRAASLWTLDTPVCQTN